MNTTQEISIECPSCGMDTSYDIEENEVDSMLDVQCENCGCQHTINIEIEK